MQAPVDPTILMNALTLIGVFKNRIFRLIPIKEIQAPLVYVEIPEFLKDLTLYATDDSFCKKFPSLLTQWKKTYPSVDVETEIKKAHVWELSNHIKKNRARFISNWLAKAQDKAGGYPNGRYTDSRHGFGITPPVGKYAHLQEPREKLG